MADIITLIRGLCALALLACPALSPAFYILYIAAWLTDAVDGAVARWTHTASERGARLDTAADLMLVVVSLLKLLPVLKVGPKPVLPTKAKKMTKKLLMPITKR